MVKTEIIRAMDMNQNIKLILRLMLRNLVEGDVAIAFHRIVWLPTPRQIPKDEIGNRRINGHLKFRSRNKKFHL